MAMVAMRILACSLAAQIAMGSRQKIAMEVTTDDAPKLGSVGEKIAQLQDEVLEAEKGMEARVADLPQKTQEEPQYADTGIHLELGEKEQGSHSIKGAMAVSMNSEAPEPTPDQSGLVPAHVEIEFTTDSQAQAEKLLENIELIIENFLGEGMRELKEQLPTLMVVGSSIKLVATHLMPYDEEQYKSIQEQMKVVTRFSISHDIYLDLDKWVKNPAMKLLDVYTGMKAGVSARVATEILEMLSGMLEGITSDEQAMAPVKEMLGDEYESVIEKLKTMLQGNEVTISVPGFDQMKEQLNESMGMTFNDTKAQFEELSQAISMTGNEYAVAALNLVQQAAAANLRFSSASVSMFAGAVEVAWTMEGMTLFNIIGDAAEEAGAEELVYGSKKPEEYNIPGVVSDEQIEEIAELGSGAFAKSCHSVALAVAAALMNWVL